MNTLIRLLRKLRFEYQAVVARHPTLALLHRPNIWWQQYKIWRYYRHLGGTPDECIVGPHTELVVDGFQGSANSFASAAIKSAQASPIQITHHLHSPAQIIRAIELSLPVLVTLRDPEGAVVSLTSRWSHISVKQALRAYCGFYETLLPYTEGMVISPFAWTTRHLDQVVAAVNEHFDTSFTPFGPTEENVRSLRDPKELQSESAQQRRAVKTEKRREYASPALSHYRERADRIYTQMLERSPFPESAPESSDRPEQSAKASTESPPA